MKVKLVGYNTDAYGFEQSLKPMLKKHHHKALVLGTGGASRAITYVLDKLDIDYLLVSRKSSRKQIKYSELSKDILQEHLIIINATPLGMSPNIQECPDIPYEYINEKHLLYDLIYNPPETEFLKRGKNRGATIKNGTEMLHLQAEKAWEIWNEKV
jgi:shikimate dehydrogenase